MCLSPTGRARRFHDFQLQAPARVAEASSNQECRNGGTLVRMAARHPRIDQWPEEEPPLWVGKSVARDPRPSEALRTQW